MSEENYTYVFCDCFHIEPYNPHLADTFSNAVLDFGGVVLGLPIRNCADLSNNLMQKNAEVNAIDVRREAFVERLYLVAGLRQIVPFVTLPSAPTSPPLALQLFLDFRDIIFGS